MIKARRSNDGNGDVYNNATFTEPYSCLVLTRIIQSLYYAPVGRYINAWMHSLIKSVNLEIVPRVAIFTISFIIRYFFFFYIFPIYYLLFSICCPFRMKIEKSHMPT